MTREDWVLLFICQTDVVLEKIILHRLLYVASREIEVGDDFFKFKPYDYGPMAEELTDVLLNLWKEDLIAWCTNKRSPSYCLTRKGYTKAYELAEDVPQAHLEYIGKLVEWGQEEGWMTISRAVCKKWPESGGGFFERENG